MATDGQQFFQGSTPAVQKGAQCPNCFTFNLLHHLPENRKRSSSLGVEVTCALCGTRYGIEKLGPESFLTLPGQEKGAA